jgi:hypothetical protein
VTKGHWSRPFARLTGAGFLISFGIAIVVSLPLKAGGLIDTPRPALRPPLPGYWSLPAAGRGRVGQERARARRGGGDSPDVSDRVELGNLKGNVGDQHYDIPAEANLNRYGTVVLWCNPFTVRIAVAVLRTD